MSPVSSKIWQPQYTSWSWSWERNGSRLMKGKSYLTSTHFSLLFSFIFNADTIYMWRSKDNLGCGSPTSTFLVEEGSPFVCQAWYAMLTDWQVSKHTAVNTSYLTGGARKWQISAITFGFHTHSGDWSSSLHTCKTRALSTDQSS